MTDKIVYNVQPVRISSGTPIGLRWARKTLDGGFIEMELQAAYKWTEGASAGIEWRAVEIVDVR